MLNVKNNAESTLAAEINDSALELTLATGEGALFPATNFHISIDDEIILCSSRTTDVCTIEREAESTTAATHASGAKVELRITAQHITDLNTATDANTDKITESTTVTSPLVKTTYDISIPAATTSVSGYLTTTDWDIFNDKAEAGQTFYIGTTQVAINRASATLNLTGIGTLNTHTIQGGTGTFALTTDITGTNSGTNTGDEIVATGAELDTATDEVKFATAKAIKDSHNVPSVAPGTDDAKFVTPKAVADSKITQNEETQTLTNKTITPRILTFTTDATPEVDSDSYDAVTITAQDAAITDVDMVGSAELNFQKLVFRIKDDGTARAITWGDDFEAKGVDLPTTTTISKVLSVGFIYDTVTSKWGCVAVADEE